VVSDHFMSGYFALVLTLTGHCAVYNEMLVASTLDVTVLCCVITV